MPPSPPHGRGHSGIDVPDDVNCRGLYPGHPTTVHFDVPTAAGRQIFSIQCCGEREVKTASPPRGSSRDRLAAVRSDSGPVIAVFVDRDGKYFTDYASSQGTHLLRHINRLMLHVVEQLEGGAQPLQQPDVVPDTTKRLEELSITATSSSSCKQQDTIWVRIEYEWALQFYTRIDHAGSFHTYPHVGGPFRCLDDVGKAIDRYLYHRLDPKMRMEQDSVSCTLEMAIWRDLYWPDGTRKACLATLPIDESRYSMLQLVKALMDKYNDDHNLSGDLAYELQRVVRYRYFHDADTNGIYYHINFATKTKGVDGFDCGLDNLLFFAELMRIRGHHEWVVSCMCRVDPSEARGCYACLSCVDHPKADAYSGGRSEDCRMRGMFCHDGPEEDLGCTLAQLEDQEASVRSMYEGLDPSYFLRIQMEEGC